MNSSPSSAYSDDSGSFGRWFLVALIVSVVIHALLFLYFRLSKLERFELSSEPQRLVPRPFEVKPAQFDPKVFEQEREVVTTDRPTKQPLPNLADPIQERPNLDDTAAKVQLAPQTEKTLEAVVNEKPSVSESRAGGKLNPGRNRAVEQELEAARRGMTEDVAPKVAASSKLPLPAGVGQPGGTGTADADRAAGFSDLDELLTRSGPLSGEVAPLNMPGGALFEYDSAELVTESIATLQKLGELVRRNPRATFSIEGHTDSFGSEEYNNALSLARAESVKAWLVDALNLDPARIRTFGYGSSKLLAPATGTAEEQRINRRVEIVIHTPR